MSRQLNKIQYTSMVMTPIGTIGIEVENQELIALNFLNGEGKQNIHPETKDVVDELFAYFDDPHYQFKQVISLRGTPFQTKIWQRLLTIPVGETRTYGLLAKEGCTSPRAVGQACRTNPIPIFVPCHRIVAAQGWGGFSGKLQGKWLRIKKWLLKHEGYQELGIKN